MKKSLKIFFPKYPSVIIPFAYNDDIASTKSNTWFQKHKASITSFLFTANAAALNSTWNCYSEQNLLYEITREDGVTLPETFRITHSGATLSSGVVLFTLATQYTR